MQGWAKATLLKKNILWSKRLSYVSPGFCKCLDSVYIYGIHSTPTSLEALV